MGYRKVEQENSLSNKLNILKVTNSLTLYLMTKLNKKLANWKNKSNAKKNQRKKSIYLRTISSLK